MSFINIDHTLAIMQLTPEVASQLRIPEALTSRFSMVSRFSLPSNLLSKFSYAAGEILLQVDTASQNSGQSSSYVVMCSNTRDADNLTLPAAVEALVLDLTSQTDFGYSVEFSQIWTDNPDFPGYVRALILEFKPKMV